jgi:hypothetical protein
LAGTTSPLRLDVRPRVEPLPHFEKPAAAHQPTQCPADLVIAAKIAEIRAQEYIAALAVDALQ